MSRGWPSSRAWRASAGTVGRVQLPPTPVEAVARLSIASDSFAVIYADQDGDTHLVVDQPSALFASYGNPAIV